MENADPDALADVAYGIFEIVLNRELENRGDHLFQRVEKEEPFWEDFLAVFSEFAGDYPQLAEALEHRFESTDQIYDMLCQGEGVCPTRTTQMYWIIQDAPGSKREAIDSDKAGKWLIFVEKDVVDALWRRIRDATCEGRLGISAKVSSAKPNPASRDDRYVIYVFTSDWSDQEDVMRVREELRELGVEERIGYKRNLETFAGEYSKKGKRVTFYSA
ncbi:MAG: putative phosphothreonine lyase domain-containing protein [Methanomicrobiales archaeon]